MQYRKELEMNRNIEIYEAHKAGAEKSELAKKHCISEERVSQIIRDKVYQFETRPAKRLVHHDQSVALFGTWVDKVYMLLPHIEAIRAIAEEKKT